MNGPMRIAFLSEHASPLALLGSVDAGGQNIYVDEVSRHLARLGHTVDVFTRRDNPDVPEVVELAPGVRVVHLAAGPARFLLKDDIWPYMPRFRDALIAFAAREGVRYDIFHGNFWMSGWAAVEIGQRLRIPVTQIFHAMGKTKQRHQGTADTSPATRIAVETEVIRRADRLIAQCPAERTELVDDYNADPGRVSIIPSAVNTQLYRPIPRDEARRRIGLEGGGPVIVYVGRMLPRKDVRNVVRAVALLARRYESSSARAPASARLLLVGGETECPDPLATPEIGELQRLAAEVGIADRILFTGKRQPETLKDYYCAGDIAVTTPWYEPFGLTPLEGQACGRPVIGSAVGGISFTIDDGVTGYLVPPRDPEALADRLAYLLDRPDLCQRMGIAARRRVERRFTWTRVAADMSALYASLLAKRNVGTHSTLRTITPLPIPAQDSRALGV